jgi:hypothetical protein
LGVAGLVVWSWCAQRAAPPLARRKTDVATILSGTCFGGRPAGIDWLQLLQEPLLDELGVAVLSAAAVLRRCRAGRDPGV